MIKASTSYEKRRSERNHISVPRDRAAMSWKSLAFGGSDVAAAAGPSLRSRTVIPSSVLAIIRHAPERENAGRRLMGPYGEGCICPDNGSTPFAGRKRAKAGLGV